MSNVTTDFIAAIKKVHGDVRLLLAKLHIIERSVESIKEAVSPRSAPTPNGEASAAHQEPGDNAPHGTPHDLDGSKAKRKENNSQSKQANGFHRFAGEWWKTIKRPRTQIELAALLGLTLYTCETRRTNNITERNLNFQLSFAQTQQRAYVDITVPNAPKLDDMPVLMIPIQLKNVGKVVANKPLWEFVLEFPLSNQPPSLSYDLLHDSGTTAPMAPGAPPIDVNVAELLSRTTVQPMTDTLRSDLKSGKRYMALFGRIQYEDFFGNWVTQFCRWWSLSDIPVGQSKDFSALNCIAYNIDGGTPKKTQQ